MTVQDAIDKQAIRDLQNFYSASIDAGAYDNLDQVFTANVIADYGEASRTIHRVTLEGEAPA